MFNPQPQAVHPAKPAPWPSRNRLAPPRSRQGSGASPIGPGLWLEREDGITRHCLIGMRDRFGLRTNDAPALVRLDLAQPDLGVVGLGRKLNLGDITCPTYHLAGAADDVTQRRAAKSRDAEPIIEDRTGRTYRPLQERADAQSALAVNRDVDKSYQTTVAVTDVEIVRSGVPAPCAASSVLVTHHPVISSRAAGCRQRGSF